MTYRLILQNSVEGIEQRKWVFQPPAVVGRNPSSQLCIDHHSISRNHCEFTLNSDGALTVRDLNSMNGIYVEDSRVQNVVLMPGQILQIGALRLMVEFSGDESEFDTIPKAKGSVYSTQPMDTIRPTPRPIMPKPEEKSWFRKIFGGE